MSLSKRLDDYYQREGISSTGFNCKYSDKCYKENSKDFTEAFAAFVGLKYQYHNIPRLLFIGSDAGKKPKKQWPPNKRTIQGVQKNFATFCRRDKSKKHWYWTNQFALRILKQFKDNLSVDNIIDYFAFTNSAKCCQNKEEMKEADARLSRNCKDYIIKEVKILNPDILMTQGIRAREIVRYAIDNSIFNECDNKYDYFESKKIHKNIAVIKINKTPVLWISTYHPSYRYQEDTKNIETFSRLAKEFIESLEK